MKVITSVFVNFILYLGLFAFCSSALYAKELVRIGVHLEHSEEPMNDLWQSFAGYLAQEMDDVSVEVTLLEHDELDEKLKRNNLDFILVDPAFYIQLNQVNGLVRVIATVRESYRGDLIPAQAGAIIARADRDDISTLKDLKNKTVGVESKEHLVTYQSQMYILHQAGVSVPDDVTLKMFHDQDRSALDAEVMLSSLLNGEIDVAFMRGGALEKMIDQGGVRKADFKIINKQHFPGYPFAVSTHLYPERPLVMMPHVEQRLAQKLVSVLYSIDPALPLLSKLNIYNFTVPMDYTPVFNVARELHLPPFDSPYDFSIVEIWKEYYIWFVILFIAILSIIMLAIVLGLSNRNLRRAREHIENGRRELARTASILSGTLENSPNVAIQWCDEIGRVRYWNPASESFYGWSSAEALDRTLDELIFMSGSRQGILEILMDAREHQAKSKPVEVNVRGQNNNQLTVLLSVFNANVADEIIFVCMQVDVSERKLAESAIRQSNERFDLVMQASNDGLWDWNLVTNEVYYSPRWKSMLGYNDHELQNKFSSWETNIDSDGLSRVTDLIEQCINGSRPGFEAEFRMRHKDGNWIDILSRGMVVRNETGQAIRFVGTHVDLTDHKQLERSLREQEQQLAQIIDHLPSMIYLKDARDLTYVHINTVFETLTGLSKSEVLGHQEYEFFPEQQASYFSEQDQTILASSNTGINSEEEINSPFGMRTLHTLRVAIKDETGQPKYLLGISEDITEQKAAKTEQERLQRELQQAHKMDTLGQLTGGIAHDFNNLLSIINGYSGLALDSCLSRGEEKLAGYMRHLCDAGTRATNLVSQMLAFSRSEQADDMPIHFMSLVKEDCKMLRATLPTSIIIKTMIEPDLPKVVMNPTNLHQIILNLSVNARDAMDGAGQLTVKLGWARGLDTVSPISHRSIKGDFIELSVSDSGTGIDAKTAKRIFDPFFTTKEVGKGTGMGLSVIYGIMEKYNGHILLESKPGMGSNFRMLFTPYSEQFCELESNSHTSIDLPSGDGSEILIVDDEVSIGIYFSEMLKKQGYEVTFVADSLDALALFTQNPHRFSLLLTDQTMPQMLGTGLISRIRDIRPMLPVILCTGYSDNINAQLASEQHIVFFEKPVEKEKLILKIAELLSSSDRHLKQERVMQRI